MTAQESEYEIETIEDFLKVPDDRIEDCLKEFKIWCELTKPIIKTTLALAEAIGIKKEDITHKNKFVWIDDGKKNITVIFDKETADDNQ